MQFTKQLLIVADIACVAGVVHAAIDLDADIDTYYPDQHDRPLPCQDTMSNIHSWIPYLSVDRLYRCDEPLLLHFSVTQPLEDPLSNVLIRSCSLSTPSGPVVAVASSASNTQLTENPKKAEDLVQSPLQMAAACLTRGFETTSELQLLDTSGSKIKSSEDASELLQGVRKFFADDDNCDESFVFAYKKRNKTDGSIANSTVAQICDSNRASPNRILGISIDTTGNLAAVQNMVSRWSEGVCVESDGNLNVLPISPAEITVFDIAGSTIIVDSDESSNPNTDGTRKKTLRPQATCRFIQVLAGDGCGSLATRCGIPPNDMYKYNPKPNLCASLQVGDYICCSPGDPSTPPKPTPNLAGTCAIHLIQGGDTCGSLASRYGITTHDIERFNRGKTWAWTDCKNLILGYNLCVSDGFPPLPPPQAGTKCGPLVPGTRHPSPTMSLADLNPCPLKACCSNWGFCGPFAVHCDIHHPPGGGPGSKEKGFQQRCVSNCGMEIKNNSGPPSTFQRIGYYESYNMKRKCLWLPAKRARVDDSYTHIHWGFAEIDPNGWKVIITDPQNQWADVKALKGVKRIISFGGWAYSTEPATWWIIRRAIIENRDQFARNVAEFLAKEGLDGVDIDWEYPGAPDIYVGDTRIGQRHDGAEYLVFLTRLKSLLGSQRSVSIAAPASFWYLKAFPIDRMGAVIDYIVYMTYDLHGQWDYGNPNAYDQCPSGKCIRSHVNLTETRPGRCTNQSGYMSYGEIQELIGNGKVDRQFHDHGSNTDVILFGGDYVSYMTPLTKDTRRNDWKALNFAGTIDWAVTLQTFGEYDMEPPDTSKLSVGCVLGDDLSLNTGTLCEYTCGFGFCPESLCRCKEEGALPKLPNPASIDTSKIYAVDEWDPEFGRLCRFACKYGFCPEQCILTVGDIPDWQDAGKSVDYDVLRQSNAHRCLLSADPRLLRSGERRGRMTNWGCIVWQPKGGEDPWREWEGGRIRASGTCVCDHYLVNEIADTIIEALPLIAQITCEVVMSSLNTVLKAGLQFILVVGQVLNGALDAIATAAQMVSCVYPEGQNPVGAFEWWLSPCGGKSTKEIQEVFDILNQVAEGISSFRRPKNIPRGSGRKGDSGNPTDRSRPRPNHNPPAQRKKCNIPVDKTITTDYIVNSVTWRPNAPPLCYEARCLKVWASVCHFYSYAIRMNPDWSTLTCEEATVTQPKNHRDAIVATGSWSAARSGQGWTDIAYRRHTGTCDRDEYPPAYLLHPGHTAVMLGGKPPANSPQPYRGQYVRYLRHDHNRAAGQMWKGVCFSHPLSALKDDHEITRAIKKDPKRYTLQHPGRNKKKTTDNIFGSITVLHRPEFTIAHWDHTPMPDDGMWDNDCWPEKIATKDPGFAVMDFDPWYVNYNRTPQWNYKKPYVNGSNGD
ncbi:hypothetical protein QBC35DRAFT_538819 [Podospora australis]|uniref:chitinase n=1 Tax=Podospora australis TaxID=1536484 RepID=A0AAN6WN85_9PEZI|nr:hypothetical protein QBC35DRAFT_538819 [Podospora australis]